jgi:MFS family permease
VPGRERAGRPAATSVAPKRPALSLSSLVCREALFPGAAIVAGAGTFGALLAYITLYGLWINEPHYNWFFTIFALALVAARIASGLLSDRVGRQVVILPALFLAATGPALLAVTRGGPGFFLAPVLFGLGYGAAQPALLAYAIDRAPPGRRGAATSTFLLAVDLGIGLFTIAFGLLAGPLGYPGLFAASAVLLLVSTLLYALGLLCRL